MCPLDFLLPFLKEKCFTLSERAKQIAVWPHFLDEDLEKKHVKVLIITEDLRMLFRKPEAAFELLEKLLFFALDSGSYRAPTEP